MASDLQNTPPVTRAVATRSHKSRQWRFGAHWIIYWRRRVNWWVLWVSLALLTPAVLGLPLWHSYQQRQHAIAFLERAKALEEQRAWRPAADCINRYLQLKPEDVEATIRRVQLLDRLANSASDRAQVTVLYAAAVNMAGTRLGLRERYAALLLQAENYSNACDQAEKILELQPDHIAALRIRALSLLARSRTDRRITRDVVLRALRKAAEHAPADVELAVARANTYRQSAAESAPVEKAAAADAVLDALIQAIPMDPNAHLARYSYRRTYQLQGADEDLENALRLDRQQKNGEVLLAAGHRAIELNQPNLAVGHFRSATLATPSDRRGYLGLCHALSTQGLWEDARKADQDGLVHVGANDLFINLQLAEVLINQQDTDGAIKILEQLDTNFWTSTAAQDQQVRGQFQSSLNRLRGEAARLRGEFAAAIAYYQRAIESGAIARTPNDELELKIEIYKRLARCFSALRQWDQAAIAYQTISELQPTNVMSRIAVADAWLIAGRLDQAISHYIEALSVPQVAPKVYVSFARALMMLQLSLPQDKRDWRAFEEAFGNATINAKESPGLLELQADFARAQNRTDDVVRYLHQLEAHPDYTPNWDRFLAIYEQCARSDEALRILAKLEEKEGCTARVLMLRSAWLVMKQRYAEAKQHLDTATPQCSSSERDLIEIRRCLIHLAEGKRDQAREELNGLAARRSGDLELLEMVASLSLDAHDWSHLANCERQLQGIEGSEGTLWRFFRAERLSRQAKDVNDPLFVEAKRLQADIRRRRPTWGPGSLLEARLARVEGAWERAISAYEQALQLGEKQIQVYEQLIHLLYYRNRVAEAEQYLDRLKEVTALSPQLSELAIAIGFRQGDIKRALQLANEGVHRNPEDPGALRWLGQALLIDGQIDEAEKALQKAIDLAPGDVGCWSALLSLYIRTKKLVPARESLVKLTAASSVRQDQRAFILAQGYEMLGDGSAAEPHYRQSLKDTPESIPVLERSAAFFLRRDVALAQRCLQKVLQLQPDSGPARRMLAMILVTSANNEDRSHGWSLLEQNAAVGSSAHANQRMKAVLLARHGSHEQRQQAIVILEKLVRQSIDVSGIDRLLLAQLFEIDGNLHSAREQHLALVSRKDPQPAHLAAYVDHLLRHDRPKDASDWLDQLAKSEPENRHFGTLSLRIRWLKKLGKKDEIPAKIDEFVKLNSDASEDNSIRAQTLLHLGHLCANMGLSELVEDLYRRAAALNSSSFGPLAAWLVTQDRGSEAVELCINAAERGSRREAAIVLADALASGHPTASVYEQAEPLLAQALRDGPLDARIRATIGTLRLTQGHADNAIELLRQAIAIDQRNLIALNNLALVLASRPNDRSEALQLIERAIEIAGNNSQLLDTKGLILVQSGRYDEGERVLREAVQVPPADPRHYFHLAIALFDKGKAKEASQVFRLAQQSQLISEVLTPYEREQLTILQRELPD